MTVYDFLRQKFKQSKDNYTNDMLIRDLIEAFGEIGKSMEYGVWTPTLTFNGGSVGLTYASRAGIYARSGKLAITGFQFTLSAKGTSTGIAVLSGLPASISPGANQLSAGGVANLATGFAGLTGPVVVANVGTGVFLRHSGATGHVDMTDANFGNASSMRATLVHVLP